LGQVNTAKEHVEQELAQVKQKVTGKANIKRSQTHDLGPDINNNFSELGSIQINPRRV
jgi:hypothetical protein